MLWQSEWHAVPCQKRFPKPSDACLMSLCFLIRQGSAPYFCRLLQHSAFYTSNDKFLEPRAEGSYVKITATKQGNVSQNPTRPLKAPKFEDPKPFLNWANVQNRFMHLNDGCSHQVTWRGAVFHNGGKLQGCENNLDRSFYELFSIHSVVVVIKARSTV